ncbi:bifunctional 3-demethylubiquinone 3-O-methyltransferase/2-octaprenyl-6-hydroxy phenol methylase [Actinosynnema sp. ALI-1.44]|nr:bifunctional 3-demethylubiquinone 3-O-methyltransferase/2-octaprenyl-6-hydroxy phenol methylase [Actinosynnema sp. ALI-1.44]
MVRARNDPQQYEDLATQWWSPHGVFAGLHWLAAVRGDAIPPAPRPGAVLVDLACGGGLLAPHLTGKGYRHVGVDLSPSALRQATDHGVEAVRGDVTRLPFADAAADVVVAGEILEHVTDLPAVVAEACRVLRPDGLLVLDTLADTPIARFLAVTVAERIPRLMAPGIHDPDLFVNRAELVRECRARGVELHLTGLRPSIVDLARWLLGRGETVRMLPIPVTAFVFQGVGRKRAGNSRSGR